VRCNIDILDARGDMDSNYIQACRLKEALLDATVPTCSISSYWIDENKKLILILVTVTNMDFRTRKTMDPHGPTVT
jgi:hypothetical protein